MANFEYTRQNLKEFLEWKWKENLHPGNWGQNPTFQRWVIAIALAYFVIISKISIENKIFITILYLLALLFIDWNAEFQGGRWKFWKRQQIKKFKN